MGPLCMNTVAGVVALALATTTYAGPPSGACCNAGDCNLQTEADCIIAGGSWAGPDTDCSECSQNNCLEDDANCQEPNIGQFTGGTILTSAPTADNFVASATGTITSICFWGAYIDLTVNADCDFDVISDSITVTFYRNAELTIPPRPNLGLVPHVSTVTVFSNRDTGQDFNLGNFDLTVNEYEFTATLDSPFAVMAGECIWIQIENTVNTANPDCAFFWEVSTEFVIDPILGDGDDVSANINENNTSSPNDFDMAFCVDQALGDVTTCTLPFAPQCVLDLPAGEGRCISADDLICLVTTEVACMGFGGTFTPNRDCREACNVANPRTFPGGIGIPGCSDPVCCTLTCEASPSCCFEIWNDECVDIALSIGCVGQPLCGGEAEVPEINCQRFSTANAFNSTFDPANPDNDQLIAADDFTSLDGGAVSIICWQGVLVAHDAVNPPDNNFSVTYYTDNNGLPGTEISSFSQSGGSLTNVTVLDTNLDVVGFDILEYTAEHAPVPVDAGVCYWIEIKNGVGGDMDAMGNPSAWFWEWASNTGITPPFYRGNGRIALDGQASDLPPDGYDITDLLGGLDLAICFKDLGTLQAPACGLDTLYLTGQAEPVCGEVFASDACSTGMIPHIITGFSMGCLDIDLDGNCIGDGFEQRRSAQPFTLPAGDWNISQIFAFGFVPDGTTNEDMNYQVFKRTGFSQPTPADSLVTGTIPFVATVAGQTNPQDPAGIPDTMHSITTDFNLPGGDYYLVLWASNPISASAGIVPPSNFLWFVNADVPPELNNVCPAENCIGPNPEDFKNGLLGCEPADCPSTEGKIIYWRSRHWPPLGDGFGFGTAHAEGFLPDDSTFDDFGDPDPDPDDLFNMSFFVRGGPSTSVCGNLVVEAGETCDPPGPECTEICQDVEVIALPCPWDCGGDNDGNVGIVDFLALLGQWTLVDTSCDFDSGGVGIVDFLALLGNWGPCP